MSEGEEEQTAWWQGYSEAHALLTRCDIERHLIRRDPVQRVFRCVWCGTEFMMQVA